jgi:dipeptidyl aminopeptidase/acylaminoacyl peptidase
VRTKAGDINFVISGQSTADGKLYNPKAAAKPLSSARIYDSIFVRHWDVYLTPQFQAVFSGSLKPSGNRYTFDGELHNLVAPIKFAESPVPPFGDSSDYDLSPDGQTVAFMSKAPELPKANLTTSYIFVGPHDGSAVAKPINGPQSSGTLGGIRGASSAPIFSPDSSKIAYMQMAGENYESDRRVIYVCTLQSGEIRTVAGRWDRSPEALRWTDDGGTFYMAAEDSGTNNRLFSLPTDAGDDYVPEPFEHDGSVRAFSIIGKSRNVLATGSALWTSVIYSILRPQGEQQKLFSSNERDPELQGLGPGDIEEFYFDGFRTKVSPS